MKRGHEDNGVPKKGRVQLDGSPDFLLAGAYPDGMEYNLRRAALEDREAPLREIPSVTLPHTDPVFGKDGPLLSFWKKD